MRSTPRRRSSSIRSMMRLERADELADLDRHPSSPCSAHGFSANTRDDVRRIGGARRAVNQPLYERIDRRRRHALGSYPFQVPFGKSAGCAGPQFQVPFGPSAGCAGPQWPCGSGMPCGICMPGGICIPGGMPIIDGPPLALAGTGAGGHDVCRLGGAGRRLVQSRLQWRYLGD